MRAGTAPAHRTDDGWRLALWGLLVAALAAIAYWVRATAGKPNPQILYQWSSVANNVVQDLVIVIVVAAIAGFSAQRLALCRPRSVWRTLGAVVAALVAIYVFELVYTAVVHPGNEQGLTPSHWEPRHAAAYVANAVVICTWVPFVEEVTYRGLGYTLLEPFGRWPAIVVVGVAFGLAHGLVLSFPVIAVFGGVLAWIRSRTGSVFPGMVLHGAFNAVALVAAVTIHN
ncbi:MAG TPA: CPBP family intramembrane glutamic endopeptidase [Gaiellaceae bacterium]|nr:CPBP family intramembrane glutamic endopeptidase [Gaiellaceae bacterium]